MRCRVCGKDLLTLGVHIRKQHNMSTYEYKIFFNIKLGTSLTDKAYRTECSLRQKHFMATHPKNLKKLMIGAKEANSKRRGRTRPLPAISQKIKAEAQKKAAKAAKQARLKRKIAPTKRALDYMTNKSFMLDYFGDMTWKELENKHNVCKGTLNMWARKGFIPVRNLY